MKINFDFQNRKRQFNTFILRAKERIEEAELLLNKNHCNGAVSRAYYAFFEAAHAVLITKGITARTHAGVIALFSLHFIKTNEISAKFIRFFKRAKEAREEADYHFLKKFTKEETRTIIDAAKDFIKAIEEKIAQ